MSKRYGPSPRAMNSGTPPTAPKARAGLLTPPGMTRAARSKASRLRTRTGFDSRDGPDVVTDMRCFPEDGRLDIHLMASRERERAQDSSPPLAHAPGSS